MTMRRGESTIKRLVWVCTCTMLCMVGLSSAFATPLSLKLVDGNGATLSGATIIAQSEGSKPVAATVQADGTYSLDIAGSKVSLVIQQPGLNAKQTIEFVLPDLARGQTTIPVELRFNGQSFTAITSDNTKAVAALPSKAPNTLSLLIPSKKSRPVGGPSKFTPSSIQLPPTPPAPAGAGCGVQTITQNTDPNTIVVGASVSCNAGGVNTDNFYARSFDLSVGPTAGVPWTVGCVDFGVETNVLDYTVTVNVYEDNNGGAPDVPPGDLVLLGTQTLFIPDGTALTVVTADFTAQNIILPADSTVVFEVFTPDRQVTDNGQFFVGSNSAGQSGPTFLKAATCGITAYVDTAVVGFPLMHWVMRVDLNTTGPIFGACCDDATGVCNDNVAIANCTGRFAANTLCANLNPPCGVVLGACCLGDGTCSQTELANCGGNWLGANTSCADCPGQGCGDCDTPDPAGAPGCSDPACEGIVCAVDPFCCNTSWDQICADAAAAMCACGPPPPPAGNDDCANASPIAGAGMFVFDNSAATTDGPPNPLCLDFATDQIDNDVWFCWTAPECAGADVTITTVGLTAVDTRIAVYDGCTCPPTLIVACNDDDPNCACLQSTVTFPATGVPYLIRIGTFPGAAGGVGSFDIICAAPPPPQGPPNDLCADAICVADGTPFNGNSDNATGTNLSSCAGTGDTNDVWHIYTPDVSGPATISLCGSAFDTSLSIFDACGGGELVCNDDACGLQSEIVALNLTAATPILIRVAGFGGATGDYTLTVTGGAGTCGTCPAGGDGDECTAPIAVGEGTFAGDTSDNTGTTGDDTSCGFGDTIDEWYCYTATCTGNATANTCDPATAFDTTLAVFDACGGAEITCNDDTCGLQSEVTWSVTVGVSYFVRVSGFGDQTGAYALNITCAAAPPPAGNDDCAGAEAIAGVGTFPFDNSAATTDGVPDPSCLSFGTDQIDNDVWFCWTSDCDGIVQVETCGLTAIDTKIAAYDGCTCPTGNGILACNDDACGGALQSSITFVAVSGQTYLIRIGTFPGVAGGTGQFSITCQGPPPELICTEPAANCQAGDLSNAATSTDGAFIVADDFNCPGPGSINSICWWGTYASGAPGADAFTVTYYDDVGGLPGAIIGGPFTGGGLTVLGPVNTGSLIANAVPEFEYVGTHAPVPVIGACYWVSVRNGIVGDTWFWELGFGNGRGLQDGTPPDGFDAGDIILGAISDMKWCLDIAVGDPNLCLPPPAGNDACADAEAIAGQGTFPFDNSAATTDGDPDPLCDFFATTQIDNDVWFCWTADCAGSVRVETCNLTGVDTKIAVYDGCTCPTGNGILACNDDDCGLQSGLVFTAVMGQSYLIRIGTFPGAAGGVGAFSINCIVLPTNDLCADAIGPLAVPSTTAGTTALATIDSGFPAPCGAGDSITSPGVWYTVLGTGNTMTASLCNGATAFDSKLSVFCRGCAAAICVTGIDDFCGLQSEVSWCSQAGSEYLILVHGFGGANGPFELVLSDNGATCSGAVQCIVEPTGACCAADGTCTLQTASACAALGGAFLGDGTDCGGETVVGSATSAPGVAIPDNDAAGASDTLTMGMSFPIQDLDVTLDIAHTWVGDLCVTLEHLGTTVTILQRPGLAPATDTCGPGSCCGCSADNYDNIVLDDEGSGGAIEDQCLSNLTSLPNYTPNNPLSAFDNMDSAGAWTLTVLDGAGGDLGTLNAWTVTFTQPGVNPCGAVGACCVGLTCTIETDTNCAAIGGAFLGTGTDCGEEMVVASPSSSPMVAIPDNDAAGASDTITMASSFSISDIDIGLGITHTWVGDLCVTLTHNGTTVTILQRPGLAPATETCGPGSCCGCSADNYNIVLDDEGTGGTIEDQCLSDLPSPPNYTPNNPLSAFDGMDSAGDWTLTVSDGASADTGTFDSWSIIFSEAGVNPCEEVCTPADCPPGSFSLVDNQTGDFSGWCVTSPHPANIVDIFVDTVDLAGGLVVIQITKSFNNPPDPTSGLVPPILLNFVQVCDDADTVDMIIITEEAVNNLTGVEWTDYHWTLFTTPVAWFDVAASSGFNIAPFTDRVFSNFLDSPTDNQAKDLDASGGGTVPAPGAYFPGFGTGGLKIGVDLTGEVPVSFTLKQRPSVGVPTGACCCPAPIPGGDEGCTPGFWKNHISLWPAGFIPSDDFDAVFGVDAFDPDLTLLGALQNGGGGVNALGRHATAALLNAASPGVDYGLTEAEVIAMVQAALAPGGDIEGTKDTLQGFNEMGCPEAGTHGHPPSESCVIMTQADCEAEGGTFQGNDTTCDPDPCVIVATGACCDDATGDCVVTTQAACGAGSTYQGDGTVCDPNPCPQPATGACCSTDGTCQVLTQADCGLSPGAVYQGDGTDCNGCFVCGIPPLTNDLCVDAIPVAVPSQTDGTTIGATNDNVGTCDTSNTAPGVWYSVVGTGNTITVTTCNDCTDFDTKLGVFCAGCDNLNCVAGNDDNCASPSGLLSTVTWCSEAGVEYLILVHAFSSGTGNFRLDISDDGVACTTPPDCAPPPVCAADFVVTAPGVFGDNTTGAGNDCDLRASEDHIYEITLPNAGVWTFSLCGSAFDTVLHLGTTCCSADIAINDDSCGLQSEITADLPAGTVWLTIEAFSGASTGAYTLDISKAPSCVPDFTVTAPGVFVGDTTASGDECPLNAGDEHVYEVTLPNDGTWTFSLCGSAYDTFIDVGTTCCGTEVGSNDDSCGLQSSVTAVLTAGTYFVSVEGFSSNVGAYTLDISKEVVSCADFVVTAPGTFMGDTTASGDECDLNAGDEHLYEVTLPNDGTWTFSLCGSAYDTFIDVGTTCCGTEVGSNDDACGLQSSVTAVLTAGTYFVAVEGFGTATGAYTLDISKGPDCMPDFVVTAPGTFMGDTTGAADDCDVFFSDGADHVYEVTLPNDGTWTFALCGSTFDTKIEVGTSCCGSDVGTNDDSCGLQSSVTATLTAGTVFVTVDGFGGQTGAYTLDISKTLALTAPTIELATLIDIKPGLSPNPFAVDANGVLPIAIFGGKEFDVATIVVSSLRLSRWDGTGGVVAPYESADGPSTTMLEVGKADGFADLLVNFNTSAIAGVLKLGDLPEQASVALMVTGSRSDGTGFKAFDLIAIAPLTKGHNFVTVTSNVAGVWIDADGMDANGDIGGFAEFRRCYGVQRNLTTFTAPGQVNLWAFRNWFIDGVAQPLGVRSIQVSLSGDHTVEARFIQIRRLPSDAEIRPGMQRIPPG